MAKKQKINKIEKAQMAIQATPQAIFFAQRMLEVKWEENSSIDTACTDGTKITYNPNFVDGLGELEIKWLVLHEIMHVQLSHPQRKALMTNADPMKANVAMDYEVNLILESIPNLKRIEGCLYDSRYAGMSWEKIYKMLPDSPNKKGSGQGQGDDKGKDGEPSYGQSGLSNDVKPSKGTKEELEKQVADNQGKNQLSKMVAEKYGTMPGGMDHVTKPSDPKLNWDEILQKMIMEKTFSDFNFRKYNKRFEDFYPQVDGEKLELIIGFDVSGSMYLHIDTLVKDIENLCYQVQGDYKITIIQFDTEITRKDIFENEMPEIKITGLGGTDFRPLFKWAEDNNHNNTMVVVLTDLDGSYPKTVPDYPVIFVDYGGYRQNVPFGDMIRIGD